MWYPSNVGSLDPAIFAQDVTELEELEGLDYLTLSHHDAKRGGVRVELTGPGHSWAAGLM